MTLVELFNGRTFSICAESEPDGTCEVLQFLLDQIPPPPKTGEKRKKLPHESAARGLLKVMEMYAKEGRAAINDSDVLHEADKASGLWEFRKGRIRVYFQKVKEDQIILLSSTIVKKQTKTASSDKLKGSILLSRYQEAKVKNTLKIEKKKSRSTRT